MSSREKYIDILKVIGLLCIMLAHVIPPKIIFQLRNFDVVLMLIISSYLTTKSKHQNGYILKRFNRLVIPTWVFLTIFMLIALATGIFKINIKNIVATYALSNYGLGYVWIIRLYFLLAVINYIILRIDNKCNNKKMLIISLFLFVLYEIAASFGVFSNIIIEYLFAYIIPCLFLFALSKTMFESKKGNIIITIISLLVFIIYGFVLYEMKGMIVSTQSFKYPFRLYYLSYGLFVSGILILLFKHENITKIFYNKVIDFMSRNSLWIYLWHILMVYILNLFTLDWYIKWILLILSSSIITLLQSYIVNCLNGRINDKILNIF